MKTITVKLEEPIKYGSETISELQIRPPKAKDMRGLPLKMGMDDMLTLLGRVCGHPPSVIDELSFDDLTNGMEVVSGFIGRGRQTGEPR